MAICLDPVYGFSSDHTAIHRPRDNCNDHENLESRSGKRAPAHTMQFDDNGKGDKVDTYDQSAQPTSSLVPDRRANVTVPPRTSWPQCPRVQQVLNEVEEESEYLQDEAVCNVIDNKNLECGKEDF